MYSVPEPVTGLLIDAFGTADFEVNWTAPTLDDLRGQRPTYYVKVYSGNNCRGEIQVNEPSALVNASVGIVRGIPQQIAVSVFSLNTISKS